MAGSRPLRNIFTVDLEEWFHVCDAGGHLTPEHWDTLPSRVESTTRLLLDMLDRASVRATFFVVGWVAERHQRLVQQVIEAGHEVGSHGHAHQRVYELGGEGFRADLEASVRALEAAGASAIRAFRAPEWSINDRSLWALPILAEKGFSADASMAPVRLVGSIDYPRHPHMKETPAGRLVEVPPLVADRFGQVMPLGWGWGLRMSSPRRVLRAIEAVNRQGIPATIAVHPWELDPDPPRTPLPIRLHFAHYFRLGGFKRRLAELLAGTSFGPIDEAFGAAAIL